MQLNTIGQVAARLAVSQATVRRLVAAAQIPAVRVGRRLREEDVQAHGCYVDGSIMQPQLSKVDR